MNSHDPDWIKTCIEERGRVLTGELAHYCFDWDGMTVDETTPEELDCCHCFDDCACDMGICLARRHERSIGLGRTGVI